MTSRLTVRCSTTAELQETRGKVGYIPREVGLEYKKGGGARRLA